MDNTNHIFHIFQNTSLKDIGGYFGVYFIGAKSNGYAGILSYLFGYHNGYISSLRQALTQSAGLLRQMVYLHDK